MSTESSFATTEVTRHVMYPSGSVEMTIRVLGPLVAPADEMLADVGGTVRDLGDQGAEVSWTWGSGTAPPDPVAACTSHLQRVLEAWAMRWAGGPIDLL
jgi:hypothetical protein